MKYSEAIRLGSMLKPQGFGVSRDSEEACANDAAFLAIGKDTRHWPTGTQGNTLAAYFPLLSFGANCPACPEGAALQVELLSVVTHLNDSHRWTRERIADWVEGREKLLEALEWQPDEVCALEDEVCALK